MIDTRYFDHYRERSTGRIFGLVFGRAIYFGPPIPDENLVDYLNPLDGNGGQLRIRKTERAQRFEPVSIHMEWRVCADRNPVDTLPGSVVEEDGG